MGIGRRDFLRMFGSTLATLSALPSPAVAVEDDLYLNRALGLAFWKPRGWHFADIRDMGTMARGQLLAIDDPAVRELWSSAEALPLVTMTRQPLGEGAGRFGSGISVCLDRQAPDAIAPLDAAIDDLANVQRIVRDPKVLATPASAVISASPGARYDLESLFEHEQLATPTRVRMHVLVVQQDDRCFSFRMYDAPDQPVDFARFEESIRIL